MPANPEIKKIHLLHERDRAASLAGDTDTLLSLFSEDGIAIPDKGDIVRGKDGLRMMLEENSRLMRDHTVIAYDHDFREIRIVGDHAYEWGFYSGTYRSNRDGTEISGSGRLMRILRKERDGSWKIARSIWTAAE